MHRQLRFDRYYIISSVVEWNKKYSRNSDIRDIIISFFVMILREYVPLITLSAFMYGVHVTYEDMVK